MPSLSSHGVVAGDAGVAAAGTATLPPPASAVGSQPATAAVRRAAALTAVLGAVLVLPLLVAAVALRRPQWFPVLDLAMTEFRVRDVGGPHTPLIGLPGRIGDFPEQGSHPGPMSFYALAPVYRLLGSSAWAMLAATLTVNALVLGGAVAVAFRRGGLRLAVAATALLALLVKGYGVAVVAEPWNPYFPLLFWALFLLAAWAVLDGDLPMLPVAVVAASFCAQTHVPYLGLCLGLGGVVLAWLAYRYLRHPAERSPILRWGAGSLALAALLWSPLVVDELTNEPGNLTMLWEHFTTPSEDPVGLGEGVRLLLLHLDVWRFASGETDAAGSLVRASGDPTGSVVPGLVVLGIWVAAAATAVRLRRRSLLAAHALVAAALVLAVVSLSRVFGKVWYYLMLWAWGISALLVLAVGLTAAAVIARRTGPSTTRTLARTVTAGLAVVAIGVSALATVRAVSVEPPAPRLSEGLAAIVPDTVEALRSGAGPANGRDGTYLVTWTDAFYIGSQGYGLVSELERRGFSAGVLDPWRVPVTHHRVLTREEATAQVHFATGFWIERWRTEVPEAVEVAFADPRTPAERREFERLRGQVIGELEAAGLHEVVPLVDGNLFGATLHDEVPDGTRRRMERMLHLGLPLAVFVTPPGVYLL